MANKVDVFTEELSKVFTILQQQYVMIKYMKALITSGELDETEINKLKEQITLMNNKLNRIIDDELVAIKQNIMRIENNITEIEKVMPTDINIDTSGHLILEHDGKEITGQKKQVVMPIYEKDKQNYYYAVETVRYDDCYIDHLFIGDPDNTYITIGRDGIIFPNNFLINHSEQQGGLAFTDINDSSTAYLVTSTNNDYILTNNNVKTINGESIYGSGDISIYGSGNIGIYMHTLGLFKFKAEYADTEYRMLITYYSSSDLKVNDLKDLTKLTKASSSNKVILTGIAFYNVNTGEEANTLCNGYCGIQFDGSDWKFRRISDTSTPTGVAITAVTDIVTTI